MVQKQQQMHKYSKEWLLGLLKLLVYWGLRFLLYILRYIIHWIKRKLLALKNIVYTRGLFRFKQVMLGPILGPVNLWLARRLYNILVMFNPYLLIMARGYRHLPWVGKVFLKIILFICICWVITPKNSEVYKYFAALFKYIISSVIWAYNSDLTVFGILSELFEAHCEKRGFHYYNSFAWWALAAASIFPLLYYWLTWNFGIWFVDRGGDYIDRPVFLYHETDFEAKWETSFSEMHYFALFYIQNIMWIRYVFTYMEFADEIASWNKYFHKFHEGKLRFGYWFQPEGRESMFIEWHKRFLEILWSGECNYSFSSQDVVIFNKAWRNKAYLITNGRHYGSWAQFIDHSPKTGKPVLVKDPIFGQTEAYYTLLNQAEHWGLCHFPYFNQDNYRFPVKGYRWSNRNNDPLHWDWENHHFCIAHRHWYERKGYTIPSNHINNYYERYYGQGYAESYFLVWLFGIDSHRLTDYSHPSLIQIIKSHALYRSICLKEGWSLDYTKFYPDYYLKTTLVDSDSWLSPYSQSLHPSLFNDVFMFSWMLCKPDYVPGLYTIRDTDFRTHLIRNIPRYATSPASTIHDVAGDILSLYSPLIF